MCLSYLFSVFSCVMMVLYSFFCLGDMGVVWFIPNLLIIYFSLTCIFPMLGDLEFVLSYTHTVQIWITVHMDLLTFYY